MKESTSRKTLHTFESHHYQLYIAPKVGLQVAFPAQELHYLREPSFFPTQGVLYYWYIILFT